MSIQAENGHGGLWERVFAHRVSFLLVFFTIFFVTYGILVIIDFIPETPKQQKPPTPLVKNTPEPIPQPAPVVVTNPYPTRMIIDSLDKDVVIQNPTSRTIAGLDTALLSGAVRHPDSADFAHAGNIFLFGHSSYLPQVFNKNFQAFNDIQKLSWGDSIRLQSADTEYRYRVTKVYKTKASDATVSLDHVSARLTLVTCNSFATKGDRFVVEAELIESYPIGKNPA